MEKFLSRSRHASSRALRPRFPWIFYDPNSSEIIQAAGRYSIRLPKTPFGVRRKTSDLPKGRRVFGSGRLMEMINACYGPRPQYAAAGRGNHRIQADTKSRFFYFGDGLSKNSMDDGVRDPTGF